MGNNTGTTITGHHGAKPSFVDSSDFSSLVPFKNSQALNNPALLMSEPSITADHQNYVSVLDTSAEVI